jgi:hypothetical protein
MTAAIEDDERATGEGDNAVYVRPRPPKDPAQVYTVRIPVAQIARLRDIANRLGLAPSTLMRNWVIERLDVEDAPRAPLGFTFEAGVSANDFKSELAASLRRIAA